MTTKRASGAVLVALMAVGAVLLPATDARAATGDFHVLCNFSHAAPDDPIVHPGDPGASHLHDFFGNVSTDAFSTFGSMQGAGTSCNFGPDTAGYWVPALIAPGGAVVTPQHITAYYVGAPGTITAPPSDLRMVAGGDTSNLKVAGYTCGEGHPTSPVPIACGGGLDMKGVIEFPSCWDGSSTDSADHRSHMAYPVGGSCPAGHPVQIPKIGIHITYGLSDGTGYSLSSDMMFGTTDGRSLHADFWNTWDQPTLVHEVADCINAGMSCNLGNGAPPPNPSPGAPMVSSFSPNSGPPGTMVTIDGLNFSGATGVMFNGVSTGFTVISDTRLTAMVPPEASTGRIGVTNASGTDMSGSKFTVTGSSATLTSFDPMSGSVGTSVKLSGTGLSGATSVQFAGIGASFVAHSSTSITATVPPGAMSGRITISTPGGSVTSASDFTVTAASTLHERRVSLLLSGRLVARGRVSVADGFSACAVNVSVKLQMLTAHHGRSTARWRTIGRGSTGSNGRFRLLVLDRTGRYRARVDATSSPTDRCGAATSKVKRHRR